MPIYEFQCIPCELTFEAVVSVREVNRRQRCPECGRMSPRIASTFAIVSGAAGASQANGSAPSTARANRKSGPPMCLQYPHIPLLCHMDEGSARRFVAHYNGRGAEYDDKLEARKELGKKRGLAPAPLPPSAGHAHGHGHNPRRHAPMPGADASQDAHASGHVHADQTSQSGGARHTHPHGHTH